VNRAVRFEAEADEEYRAAARWYEERRAGLGVDFLDAVNSTLLLIVRFPNGGASVPRLSAGLAIRRAPVRRFPYHVIYLVTDAAIRVLAVAHDRRRPGYWQPRIS
jgi:plasmid stabilization system protein ParE